MLTVETRPARYEGRHRPGHTDTTGRRIIAAPVPPTYSPLPGRVRLSLAPTAHADDWMPAGVDELTGRIERVLAPAVDDTQQIPAVVNDGPWFATTTGEQA
ncbi:hypothetical protein [Polymorphospora rubra]|uniref:Uncharacterized protein n=1 Tax=Polymorphospora rubra TaxID=338584 RepID=A0A810MSD2_9ACTN|nr:hypothetical protein [Polymorphospora rubra]BCJ64117.1 hypothetical protein Prubr_11380 [Polymorphospora rubra]